MNAVNVLLISLAGLAALFLAVILVRAALFVPKNDARSEASGDVADMGAETKFDRAAVAERLARMIRVPTVSNRDESLVDRPKFAEFRALLETLYPLVTERCPREDIGTSGIVYRWKGKSADGPTVLMAHYDVVPATNEGWEHLPFSGDVDAQGTLWGRGAIDTKITVCGILEAAEKRIAEGFVPERDIWIAFSGDEEIMGPTAPAVVDWLDSKGVRPALVLDEGGAVVANVFPGVKEKCAVIGITEKGMMDVEFSVRSPGGHASTPPVRQPVATLARAIGRVNARPFPARLTPAARSMFDTLGRISSFAYKILFANLWCFLPLLKKICALSGGELNALMRTTCCFTVLEGGPAYNVMPAVAKAGANLRILQGETMETAFARLRRTINDPRVEMRKVYGFDPSPVANLAGSGWSSVERSVRSTWTEAIVSPYLMVACTDSRHYGRICDTVLRFSAMELTKEERATMHAKNERIPSEKIPAFFYRLIGMS
jgi:carboxypeptidase PM20D1